jgi:hypothetical protein
MGGKKNRPRGPERRLTLKGEYETWMKSSQVNAPTKCSLYLILIVTRRVMQSSPMKQKNLKIPGTLIAQILTNHLGSPLEFDASHTAAGVGQDAGVVLVFA